MKLRLTQPGFETYTGQMGVIFFEDGLSTADVREIDAIRMAAVMLCEREDGSSPSIAQSILDNAHTAAPIFEAGASEHDHEAKMNASVAAVVAPNSDVPRTSVMTAAQLHAIADKDGIKGLRLIGDALNIKSNSIREMIDAILKAQPAAAAE